MPLSVADEDKLLKKFEKIDGDWRHNAESGSVDQLKAILVEVTRNEGINQEEKSNDETLAAAKAAKEAAEFKYKDATAMNKLKIKFILRHLEASGG